MKKMKRYILYPIVFLSLLFQAGCRETKKNDSAVWWLMAYLANPPQSYCSGELGRVQLLEKSVTVTKTSLGNFIDGFHIKTPNRESVTVKIAVKNSCILYRDIDFCQNNVIGYATTDEHRYAPEIISCSDGTIISSKPIEGAGSVETCKLSFQADYYSIGVFSQNKNQECTYEISYN